MNLRKTTILVVFTTFLLLALVLSISLQNVLSAHFQNEEIQQNYLNLQRVNAAFRTNFAVLNYLADDWSNRVDALEFVQKPDPEFITDNLSEATFNKLDVNVVIIKDAAGNTILARGYDLENDQFVNISPGLEDYLKLNQGVLDFTDSPDNNDGLIMLDERLLLVAASAVTGGQSAGPIRGYFLIGRYFGDAEVQKLAQQIQFPVTVDAMSDPSLPNDFALAKNYFSNSPEDTYSLPLTETNLGGYLLLRDVNQQPALIIRIEQFRSVARNTQLFLSYLYLALIASSLVFATIFFALIERTILSRIFRLDKEVQAITSNPEEGVQVTVDKKDEISVLSKNINSMMVSLRQTEQERNVFEQRLQGIVDSIDDIVFTIDSSLQEVKFFGNHPFLKGLSGFNIDELHTAVQDLDIPREWIEFHREKAKIVLS
ncbi:MAG TPA: CHASE4 domain-containing protein, partial [Anaerovoracaceae bacterium]|nr:CHASE4 domain-containing protein [Anaerovoracaceae bacterium]